MAAWPHVALGEFLTQDRNYVTELEPRLYPKLSVKLYGRGVVLDAPADATTLKMERHQLAKDGQVILSEIWGKKGAIGIVPPEGEGALVTSHFFLFDIDESRADRGYVGWVLRSNYLESQLGSEARGTTGYAAVRPPHLLAATAPLPPLDEQCRIVARVEQVAAKIEEARAVRATSARTVTALEAATAAETENDCWPALSIEQIVGRANLKNGVSIKSAEGTGARCLTLSSMRGGKVRCDDTKPVPLSMAEAAAFQVREGDVFIVRGNGAKHLVGRAGKAAETRPGVIFPDLFIRVPLDHHVLDPDYFVSVWNSPRMRTKIEEAAKTTSGIWKINQGHIAAMSIPVPPLAEQRRIVGYLQGIQSKVDTLRRHQAETGAELDALLPAILDKAFKGEL